MQIELTKDYVVYVAEGKLLELSVEIAEARNINKPDVKAKIAQADKIRLWLEALDYSVYLDLNTQERIWYALSEIAQVNDIPVTITTSSVQPPSLIVGVKGDKGDPGATGATGGAISFSASNVNVDTVVDSFDVSLATAAEWKYIVTDGTNQRVEHLHGTWLSGVSKDDGGVTIDPEFGSTSGISFFSNISGSTVQFIAHVTSGSWTVSGSRILIPASGNGITLPTSLTDGSVWIGNTSNQPQARVVSGAITITDTGVSTLGASVVVDSNVSATAAIAVSKLSAMTANKAVVTDSLGFFTTSTTTATQVGYLSNVTSDIQAQINAIAGAGTITGAITTFVTSNATANRAIISNAAGKLTVSPTSDTQIGYLQSTTSDVQTQLDGKEPTIGYTPVNKAGDSMTGVLAMGSNKITGVTPGSAAGEVVTFEELARTVSNGVSRSLDSAFQPSLTKDAWVTYSVEITTFASSSGLSGGIVSLSISPDGSSYTEIGRFTSAITKPISDTTTFTTSSGQVSGFVPAGYYVKIITSFGSFGGATFTYITGQEMLYY